MTRRALITLALITATLIRGMITSAQVDLPTFDTNPEWSPNGDLIAFVSNRNGSEDIWVVRLAYMRSEEAQVGWEDRYPPTFPF